MRTILLMSAALTGCTQAARNEVEPAARNETPRQAAARESAYAIRGVRQPGHGTDWRAVILDGRILLDSPTSAGWASMQPTARREGNRRLLETRYLTLTIESGPCDLREVIPVLPDRVILEWDGGRFEGCGGPRLVSADIAGTWWELMRIGDAQAPAEHAPAVILHFGRNGGLGGTLSCNDGGIRTTWTGDGGFRRGPSGFEQTAVGCNDPAGDAFGRRFWSALETAQAWRRDGDRAYITFADGSQAELRYLIAD